MKRLVIFSVVLLAFALPTSARAMEDKPEKLLEAARSKLDDAADAMKQPQRDKLIAEAVRLFKEYLEKSPPLRERSEVLQTLAFIELGRAKEELFLAHSKEDPDERQASRTRARSTISSVVRRFEELDSHFDKALKSEKLDPTLQKILERMRSESALKAVQVQYYLADTYGADRPEDRRMRDDILRRAIAKLEVIEKLPDPAPIAWLARAWHAEVLMDLDEIKFGQAHFQEILKKNASPETAAGVRMARFFMARRDLLEAMSNQQLPKVEAATQKLSSWLQDYRAFSRSDEGYASRYLLAVGLKYQGDALVAKKKPDIKAARKELPATTLKLYEAAEKLFAGLCEDDNLYSIRAVGRLAVLRKLLKDSQESDKLKPN